ncbi:unnamed protein product [Lymnaea stagnalis]|uniref:Ribonucleases P/MRP subunit Pop8-like domain-containing protein n=1 Tax=Lymnaea stagnalis TaxID=6523 RepID=A0AAV2GZ05_LYMST
MSAHAVTVKEQDKRLISSRSQPYVYFKVKLTIENEDTSQMTDVVYKFLITKAVAETLGEVGAAICVDLLKLFGNGVSIIRVPSSHSEKLWAALTLYGTTPAQARCAFRVLQVSSFLMGLAFDTTEHS